MSLVQVPWCWIRCGSPTGAGCILYTQGSPGACVWLRPDLAAHRCNFRVLREPGLQLSPLTNETTSSEPTKKEELFFIPSNQNEAVKTSGKASPPPSVTECGSLLGTCISEYPQDESWIGHDCSGRRNRLIRYCTAQLVSACSHFSLPEKRPRGTVPCCPSPPLKGLAELWEPAVTNRAV